MSPITRDDLHRIFKNLDKNDEGLVSIDELQHLLDKIGIHTTLEELEKLVGRTSLDYIEFFFFYEAMVKAKISEIDEKGDDPTEDLRKAFKVFDLNGDGYISSEELQSVLLRLGLMEKKSCGVDDCKEMIHVYDRNSDGVLDFEEFKDMMSVPPPKENFD